MLKRSYQQRLLEAGCDEAGRGCLAGPVFAAAVILPKDYRSKVLNDSKQLSEKQRYQLRTEIEQEAIAWSVGQVDREEIDQINILNASFLAMHRAINTLSERPGLLLIDGNRFTPYYNIPHHCIIGGDAKYLSIAAASVLAKTYRDDLLLQLDLEFPQYQWSKNKGYGTAAHRKAILEHGISPHHRLSFRLLPDQLSIPF
jgi:ribonuclease HII